MLQANPLAACLCGWTDPAAITKRAQRVSYAAHLAAARAAEERICRDCKETKYIAIMSKSHPTICRPCARARMRAWIEANPTRWERARRKSHLKKRYGITVDDYNAMLDAQGGGCAICGGAQADGRDFRLHVDHDHETGRVRGILCGSCNRGLGNLGDDPDRCEAAAKYLRRNSNERNAS